MNYLKFGLSVLFLCLLNTLLGQNEVVFMWAGALQPTSVKVNAKLSYFTKQARLVVSPSRDFSGARIYSNYTATRDSVTLLCNFEVKGLKPNTLYYYAVEDKSILDASADDIGQFRTPTEGPMSFTFAVGACNANPDAPVFGAWASYNPLFLLEIGDFHYENPNSEDIAVHRIPFEHLLSQQNTNTQLLLQKTPVAYMWDDHDYCGNDTYGDNLIGTRNARQAYQEYVPHYPLVEGGGNIPIYQSFTVGRVRFILMDCRSVRQYGVSMLGNKQKAWLKNEILAAHRFGYIIALISSVPLYSNAEDSWGGFGSERTELLNFLRDNDVKNLFFLCGDAHMLAIDDGTNAQGFYSGKNNVYKYPLMHAAAIYNWGSNKGGEYSHGYRINATDNLEGQFGLVKVTDKGDDSIRIEMSGKWLANANPSVINDWNAYTFTRAIGRPYAPIEWLDFKTYKPRPWQVELVWTTAREESGFSIQVSRDSINFRDIDFIKTYDNQTLGNTYRFVVSDLTDNINYFRIKNMDRIGTVTYSSVQKVKTSIPFRLFPNPSRDLITLATEGVGNFEFQLYDVTGRLIFNKKIDTRFKEMDVSDLLNGVYFYRIYENETLLSNGRFIKLN